MTIETYDDIVEFTKNIKKSKETSTIELPTRPYSRRLVQALCLFKSTPFETEKSGKKTAYNVNLKGEDIKTIMSFIAKEARKGDNKVSQERNAIVEDLVSDLGVTIPEPEKAEKPKKVKKEKVQKDDLTDEAEKAPAKKPTAKKPTAKKAAKKATTKKAA